MPSKAVNPSPFALQDGISSEVPVAGFYRGKLARGGVPVGIKIWHGAPLDPITGEELDRSHRWNAVANGRPLPIDRAWPWCAGDPIDEREYLYLTGLQAWAEQNAPDSPHANPRRRVDPLTAPTPF